MRQVPFLLTVHE